MFPSPQGPKARPSQRPWLRVEPVGIRTAFGEYFWETGPSGIGRRSKVGVAQLGRSWAPGMVRIEPCAPSLRAPTAGWG